MNAISTCHRLSLAGRLDQCAVLRRIIRGFGLIENFSDPFISTLELAVHEAFANACIHGNGNDHGRRVSIVLRICREGDRRVLDIRVSDCGKGFDPERVPDPTTPEGLQALSGRGLWLIRSAAESLRVECGRDGSVLALRYIPY